MAVEGIFTYYITGDYASIGCNSSASGDIVIPETIGGYTVNKILSYGFENPNITSIVLPNSITEISDYAFCNCSSLASINIPNNITSIGIMAFKNTALTSFNWPANITRIPGSCFYGSQLASINIFGGDAYLVWRSRGQHRLAKLALTKSKAESYQVREGSITMAIDNPIISLSLELDDQEVTV